MEETPALDKLDRAILRRLQDNGRETYDQVGEQVGLSASAVLRRVKRLEEAGVIDRYVALHADAIRARLLPVALDVFQQHRARGDRVLVATGAPPELARAILAFVAHADVPVIGTLLGPRLGGMGALRHCHHAMKMTMLRAAGFTQPVEEAYSDSSADLPLLHAARKPVVVNPKPARVAMFRRVLPPGTPILNWGCPGRAGDPAR